MEKVDFLKELNANISRLNSEDDTGVFNFLVRRIAGMCTRQNKEAQKKDISLSSGELEEKVYTIIKKHGSISRGELIIKCQSIGAKRLTEIMSTLIDSNLVTDYLEGRKTIYHIIQK